MNVSFQPSNIYIREVIFHNMWFDVLWIVDLDFYVLLILFCFVRSHTGERPYKCVQCSRGFASSGVLKAHIRTHSGLKAYKCLVCDTTFTTSGSLRRHMTTHSDLRPYMCPYCQKTFKSSPNCRKHMKTHRSDPFLDVPTLVRISLSMFETVIDIWCAQISSQYDHSSACRYELAQQLQPQSAEDHLGASAVAHDLPVEMETESLQQGPPTTAEQQGILGLAQTEVVNGGQQVTLEAPLTDQPLVQGEGKTFIKIYLQDVCKLMIVEPLKTIILGCHAEI